MQLGMIGLGRMGANLVLRLMEHGHVCVVYDLDAQAVTKLADKGATGASSLDEFVTKLTAPRAAWIMVPAAYVGTTVDERDRALRFGRVPRTDEAFVGHR